MKITLKNWKCHYNSISLPYKWWKFESLFDRMNWAPGLYPGYLSALKEAFDNVMVFLTPWYKPRRDLLSSFMNPNSGKLLDSNRKSLCIRTRGYTTAYYTLTCGFLTAKLIREVYVDKDTGKSCNMFITAVCCGLGDQEPPKIDTQRKEIPLGFILTRKQCQKALDRAVDASPDLEWFDSAEEFIGPGEEDD